MAKNESGQNLRMEVGDKVSLLISLFMEAGWRIYVEASAIKSGESECRLPLEYEGGLSTPLRLANYNGEAQYCG